ncbi:MAG: YceD family protein [Ilumatobacteraceae bacterium]|jgi:uncharacterized protein
MANPLRVHIADLLRRPGSEKDLDLDVSVLDLGIVDERFVPEETVAVRLHLESLTDGLVVRGHVVSTWHGICRRCAMPAQGTLDSDVHELYQHVITDPDAFELEGDVLDLEPMVREVVVLDAPVSPLCTADCAGLCPQCGIDRNTESCGCAAPPSDDRWSALEQLKDIIDP